MQIVSFVLYGLYYADCILPSAVFYRLGSADKRFDVTKEEGLIVRNCIIASNCTFYLVTKEYVVPKTDVFVYYLRNCSVKLLDE